MHKARCRISTRHVITTFSIIQAVNQNEGHSLTGNECNVIMLTSISSRHAVKCSSLFKFT